MLYPITRRPLFWKAGTSAARGLAMAGDAVMKRRVGMPIYLDMQASTPMDPRVMDAMHPYFTERFGNPHSRTHVYGWEAEKAVENARTDIADLICADPAEIVYTSGATESNNIAIKGVAGFYGGKKKHIITSQIEHKCVLNACRAMEEEGFTVTYLPVDSGGCISLERLEKSIRPETLLVSIMAINNEIGTIQPIQGIGDLCRRHGVFFHTDAAQAVGKIKVDVKSMNIDMLSISGHKIYGPKGIGALFVRRRPRIRIKPLFSGGGQERGIRSGTVPAPLAVGLGAACRIAKEDMRTDYERICRLSKKLVDGLKENIPAVIHNGEAGNRYPGCVNLSFGYVEGESLLMAAGKTLALSSGSACTSASLEPSYVIQALGGDEDMAHSSIRFGIGRFTTEEDIDTCIGEVTRCVQKLRDMSPLWDMYQNNIDIKKIQWADH